jgi:DsbE subfamily thiol:disulfide oxidoreductase
LKRKAVILGVLFLLGLFVVVMSMKKEVKREMPPEAGTTVGRPAPELSVRDTAGKTYTLSALKGSVVFINFWASWCQPCKEEMSSLQALYNRFKGDPGFRLVTILYRDDYEKARALMKEGNYEFPVYLDEGGRSAAAYGVTGVPETYIVDKKGILREKVIGPADWNSPQAISAVATPLQE